MWVELPTAGGVWCGVRKTRTAGVAVASVRSPPMERPSVCGLAAYAALNKPSKSPLCQRLQVYKQFVSTVGAYTGELYAKQKLCNKRITSLDGTEEVMVTALRGAKEKAIIRLVIVDCWGLTFKPPMERVKAGPSTKAFYEPHYCQCAETTGHFLGFWQI